MKPNTSHASQALLPDTHTTDRIPGVLLHGMTTAAEGSFATQFTDRGTGQSHTVRPCTENGNGAFSLPQTVGHGGPPRKRQRIGEGAAPAGLLPQPFMPGPASTTGADSWGDPQKASICTGYAAALEPMRTPGLSVQGRLQKLEAFRTTCHRLINESWQWLRMDLADEIAAAGEAFYSQMAPVLAKQANTPVVPFYEGFEPWGLQMLNAELAQASLLGQVVQVSLLPPPPVRVPPDTQAGATSTTTTTTTAAGRARAVAPVPTEASAEEAPLHDDLEPLFTGFGDDEFR